MQSACKKDKRERERERERWEMRERVSDACCVATCYIWWWGNAIGFSLQVNNNDDPITRPGCWKLSLHGRRFSPLFFFLPLCVFAFFLFCFFLLPLIYTFIASKGRDVGARLSAADDARRPTALTQNLGMDRRQHRKANVIQTPCIAIERRSNNAIESKLDTQFYGLLLLFSFRPTHHARSHSSYIYIYAYGCVLCYPAPLCTRLSLCLWCLSQGPVCRHKIRVRALYGRWRFEMADTKWKEGESENSRSAINSQVIIKS